MLAGMFAPRGSSAPPVAFPTFVSASPNVGTSSSTLSISWPSGYMAGDLGLFLVQSPNQPPASVSGWALVATNGVGTAGAADSTSISVYSRIAMSGSESTASVSVPGSRLSGAMAVFRGVNAATPIEGAQVGSGTTGAIVLPSLTTSGANRLVLSVVGDGRDANGARYSGWTNADLSDLAERFDAGTASGVGGGIGLCSGQRAAAGAVGAGSVTFDLSSTNYAAASFALVPA